MSGFQFYREKALQPMRPYAPGEDLAGVSVSAEDTPELGGMIAVNPSNPADKWYVAKAFFEANYAPAGPSPESDFLERLGERGGAIVSSGACSAMEIADARARGDMFVTEEGYGFVLRLPEWLAKVQP